MDTAQKEINLLRKFRGPYVVELHDSEISQIKGGEVREAYLLLEYCPHGHLLQRLNARNGVPLGNMDILKVFVQVLSAVKSMHEQEPPVVHRDIKLENILFAKVGTVAIFRRAFSFTVDSSTLLRYQTFVSELQ